MGDSVQDRRDSQGSELDAFWTLANCFSLLRVLLVGPTLWLIALGYDYRWEMFSFVMAMILTDILDGLVARRRNEVSRWGKILDPIADKLAIDSITISLIYLKGMPLWVGIFVIGRDLIIVLGGLLLMTRDQVVVSSNVWGKMTTIVMSLLLLSYAMDWEPIKLPVLVTAGALLFISSISYGAGYVKGKWKEEEVLSGDPDGSS